MDILKIFEGEMTTKQMGIVIIIYMVALVVFGILAVIVIHGLGWQWLWTTLLAPPVRSALAEERGVAPTFG